MQRPLRFATFAAAALLAGHASGYNLKQTDDGRPVHWETDSIEVIVDPSLDAIGPGARDAARAAFSAWAEVPGVAAPEVTLVPRGAAHDPAAGEPRGTLRYAPAGYEPAGSALAITAVTFDATGVILRADIVVNGGAGRGFAVLPEDAVEASVSGVPVPYDLQNVLTHEVGHFFGLAHDDADREVTMFATSGLGETKKRTLAADDEAGLEALYAASEGGGLSCAASRAGGARGSAGGVLAALGLALALRRRAATRPEPRRARAGEGSR